MFKERERNLLERPTLGATGVMEEDETLREDDADADENPASGEGVAKEWFETEGASGLRCDGRKKADDEDEEFEEDLEDEEDDDLDEDLDEDFDDDLDEDDDDVEEDVEEEEL